MKKAGVRELFFFSLLYFFLIAISDIFAAHRNHTRQKNRETQRYT